MPCLENSIGPTPPEQVSDFQRAIHDHNNTDDNSLMAYYYQWDGFGRTVLHGYGVWQGNIGLNVLDGGEAT